MYGKMRKQVGQALEEGRIIELRLVLPVSFWCTQHTFLPHQSKETFPFSCHDERPTEREVG